MFTLVGHDGPVHMLAFAPDGMTLASGGRDGSVRIRAMDGERLRVECGGPVQAVAFSHDGRMLAVGGIGGPVRLIDTVTGKITSEVPPPPGPSVTGLVFLPDARTLAIATGDRARSDRPGYVALWNTQTRKMGPTRHLDANGIVALAGTPKRRALAIRGGGGSLAVWDVVYAAPKSITGPRKPSPAAAFGPDGRVLAIADDWEVRIFDSETGAATSVLAGHKGRVGGIAFGPDGRTLATGSWDGIVRVWDLAAGGRERAAYHWDIGRITAIAYAPDGLLLAAAGDTGNVLLWDAA